MGLWKIKVGLLKIVLGGDLENFGRRLEDCAGVAISSFDVVMEQQGLSALFARPALSSTPLPLTCLGLASLLLDTIDRFTRAFARFHRALKIY
jgi:hypothetical protein